MSYYAHTVEGRTESDWEPLEEHLELVGSRARRFAEAFGAGQLGRVAGIWHDLGKYASGFQSKIRGERLQVEHAGAGAALALQQQSHERLAVAFAIAGHHAGLANLKSNDSAIRAETSDTGRQPLVERIASNKQRLDEILPVVPEAIRAAESMLEQCKLIQTDQSDPEAMPRKFELLTRMLFSALIDADRVATAAFYAGYNDTPTHAMLDHESIGDLLERLSRHQAGLNGSTPVGAIRREILDSCMAAAEQTPGVFALTAPTGGGKTLSAMRFALEHAVKHGLRRVIVVIPYTSIIEQNAQVYREVFNDANVLEHHSNLDEERLDKEDSEREIRRKLAAENWNCPIVVTTTVQFFESLFSDHPSRCRKLHNVAKSVVLLDEVQTLPPGLLDPILDVLGDLAGPQLGCSIVLSTATPPALLRREGLPYGLAGVRSILPDPAGLAGRARRVGVEWQVDTPIPYDELAARLAKHDSVLAIVHRRDDARQLAEDLVQHAGTDEVFHLSASMCPAHRLVVLAQIHDRLKQDQPCRVVSTQLVEAGVDLDFPVVYRALAGLDSLAQAAGRCDREGRLTEANRQAGRNEPGGRLIVFKPTTKPPPGVPTKAAQTTESLLMHRGGELDIFDPDTCERYFRLLYGKEDTDIKRIQLHRQHLDFFTTGQTFRMIDSQAVPIVVPWGGGIERIGRFRDNLPTRDSQRALQPFTVQINRFHRDSMAEAGLIERVHDRVDVLLEQHARQYSERWGLDVRSLASPDPNSYIV